jgi:hypothetical protein
MCYKFCGIKFFLLPQVWWADRLHLSSPPQQHSNAKGQATRLVRRVRLVEAGRAGQATRLVRRVGRGRRVERFRLVEAGPPTRLVRRVGRVRLVEAGQGRVRLVEAGQPARLVKRVEAGRGWSDDQAGQANRFTIMFCNSEKHKF